MMQWTGGGDTVRARCAMSLRDMSATLGVALAVVISFMAGSAQAFDIHKYLSTPHITEVPAISGVALPGPVTELDSMTVANGDLWIAEDISGTSSSRIDEFDAETGAFMAQPVTATENAKHYRYGIAIAKGDLYVGDSAAVAVFTEAGSLLETWTEGCSGSFGNVKDVAADNSGSAGDLANGFVYVLDGSTIDVFKPESGGKGTCVESFTVSEAKHLAVDQGNGDVAVATDTAIEVFQRTEPSAGTYEYRSQTRITGPPPTQSFACRVGSVAFDSNGGGEIYAAIESPCVGSSAAELNSVEEFNASGAYLGHITGEETPLEVPESIAVDPGTHRVFIGVKGEPGEVDAFGRDIVVPNVETEAATGQKPTEKETIEATLNGTVELLGEGKATCAFVWATSEAALEGQDHERSECEAPVTGTGAVAVQAKVILQPDTTYFFRLQATNKNGTNAGEAWQDHSFTTPGPGLHGESASEVSAEAATLEATINPHQMPTTYYFEYGPSSAYGYATPLTSIGSGEGDVQVSRQVTEHLSAHTTYHYRVVVESELEGKPYIFDGPDQTFVTQRAGESLRLLDGRQWELVSPPDKHGQRIYGLTNYGAEVTMASPSGNAITYVAIGATESNPQGAPLGSQILSTRSPEGWSSQDIALARQAAPGFHLEYEEFQWFSEDLSVALVEPIESFSPPEVCASSGCELASSPEATEQTLYLCHNTTCESDVKTCYEPLVTAAKVCGDIPSGEEFGGHVHLLAATPDGKHVVERLSEPIGGIPGGFNGASNPRHAISEDGSRIFWDKGEDQLGAPTYLEVTDLTKKETLQIGNGKALYETASADGSEVFFSEPGKLYACRIVEEAGKLACQLTDLAPGAEKIGNVSYASEDGSYVYFVATGALSGEEASPRGETAVAGAPNLYMRHYNVAAEQWEAPRLIAVLSPEDERDYGYFYENSGSSEVLKTTARVSPNGRWLTFMSQQPLTGYDNRDINSGKPDQEVYLYHVPSAGGDDGSLDCVSCNPTGARPAGEEAESGGDQLVDTPLNFGTWFSASTPGWIEYHGQFGVVRQPRYLSDGGRVFFDSTEALVPQDVNGAIDVYEYEPPKSGETAASDSCTTSSPFYSERDSGCIDLISSGESPQESAFLDASENGNDVFFLTRSKLVGKDYDTAYDVYDAHVCTSEAPCIAETPPEPLPCVDTESCREAPQPQPSVFGPPPSATFSGVGDLTPPTSKPTVKPKALTRAQKLKRALSACRKKKNKRKRAVCKRRARKSYGAKASGAKSAGEATRSSGRGGR
jgi:hypothetical protein